MDGTPKDREVDMEQVATTWEGLHKETKRKLSDVLDRAQRARRIAELQSLTNISGDPVIIRKTRAASRAHEIIFAQEKRAQEILQNFHNAAENFEERSSGLDVLLKEPDYDEPSDDSSRGRVISIGSFDFSANTFIATVQSDDANPLQAHCTRLSDEMLGE